MSAADESNVVNAASPTWDELDADLRRHLLLNHYPPLPHMLVRVARDAIELMRTDDDELGNTEILLPKGCRFRGRSSVTAAQVVDALNLECFLTQRTERKSHLAETA